MQAAQWFEAREPSSSLSLAGWRGIALLICLALLAAWTGRQAVVFLIVAALAVAAIGRLWADRALLKLSSRLELREDRAFAGETLRVQLIAENRKPLPLSWLRIRTAIPPALTPTSSVRRWLGWERDGYLEAVSAIGWQSRAIWEFDLPCRQRGVYELGPTQISTGDPFGFYLRRTLNPDRRTVVVYPRIVPLRTLGFPLAPGFGVSQRRRSLLEDPSRSAGVREYQPGDPLRRVHWKATARVGELQVRVLEPAAAPLLLLVLACDTFDFPWSRYREDIFELAASALASVAWRALEDGWPVGLLSNSGSTVKLPPSSSPQQLVTILEELARATPSATMSVAQLLADQQQGFRPATYVLALGRPTNALETALQQLSSARRPTVLLYGDEPPTQGPSMAGYRLRQWDDLAATLEGAGEAVGGR